MQKEAAGLAQTKENVYFLNEKSKKYEEAQKVYKNLEADLEKINEVFINPEFPVNIIEFLENTAANSGISIEKIAPFILSASETDPWEPVGFQITIIDSFPSILKFLDKIENSPYLIEIQNFSAKVIEEEDLLSQKCENCSTGDVNVFFVIKIFTKENPKK